MEEKHRIKEEINTAISLRMLATAYEEISVTKIQLARDSVLHTREFLSSLAQVLYNVKSSYKNRLQEMIKNQDTKGIQQFKTHVTNDKHVLVFLSSNNKLYGEIIPKVFHLFLEQAKNPNIDLVIVGRLGKELYQATRDHRDYTYFEIPDISASVESLKPLVTFILQYESVSVCYGKFINVVTQEAEESNITGEGPFTQKEEGVKEYGFIVEPSIEKVLDYFQSQILSSLFQQTIHEAELARFASRIKSMEQALVYINGNLHNLKRSEQRVKHLLDNKKQQERVAGMRLWR